MTKIYCYQTLNETFTFILEYKRFEDNLNMKAKIIDNF